MSRFFAVRSSPCFLILVALGISTSTSRAQTCSAPDYCRQIKDFRQSPEVDLDFYGFATAISGDTVAVSDLPQGWDLTGVGTVRVYREVSGVWNLEQTIAAPVGNEAGFGYGLALEGDLLVVSAPAADVQGRAFVFRRNGTTWSFEAELAPAPPTPPTPRRFGSSMAIDGDRIVVGSLNWGWPFATNGAVYVYRFDGSTWNFETRLIAPDPAIEDGFGGAVDMSGDWMVVGARGARCPGGDGCGAIYFFRLSADSWTYHSSIYGTEHSNPIGDSVALDGTVAAYGMPFDNDPAVRVGSVHILQFNGTNWVEEVRISHPNPMVDRRFGWQVGLEGETVVAASMLGSTCHSGGTIYVFRRDQGQWQHAGTLGENEPTTFYGTLSMDGGRATIGSYDQACQVGSGQCGAAFLFSAGALGNDCDCDGEADACESCVFDCNGNGIGDVCDISEGTSQDCNEDGTPDECGLGSGDCNQNGTTDVCDLAVGTSEDCNFNDFPDECDISLGWSDDENNDGIPDECGNGPLEPLMPDPSGFLKSKFISLVVPAEVGASTQRAALRVDLVSLHHVDPPYPAGPSIPFSLFEGEHVWVGPPRFYVESSSTGTRFVAASTQCTPHYRDWSAFKVCTGAGNTGPVCPTDHSSNCPAGQTCTVTIPSGPPVLHIFGSAIVPSSVYNVVKVAGTCEGFEDFCMAVSPPLEIRTTRWADVAASFNPPAITSQPDFADCSALVAKFRSLLGAPIKARSMLASDVYGNLISAFLANDLNFSQIAHVVDAFRGNPYPSKMGKCAASSGACSTDAECGANGPCNLYCP